MGTAYLVMISTTCSLKWVNELQHEILSQLIICFTLEITLFQTIFSSQFQIIFSQLVENFTGFTQLFTQFHLQKRALKSTHPIID